MGSETLRALTGDEIASFERDGVICCRAVIPEVWLGRVGAAIERNLAAPSALSDFISLPERGYHNDIFMWLVDDDYRAFVLESPAAALARQVLGSSGVTFFYDQLFVKEQGADVPTPWHHDLTFWPVVGDDVCSIWMPLDPVGRESSGLEYVRGSHRWPNRYQAITPDHNEFMVDPDLEEPPDVDGDRAAYDLVSWEMEPGDALIFHPLVVHGSSGNGHGRHRRRALATRWFGDDVRYDPRPATMPLPPDHGLAPGDKFGGPMFPRLATDLLPIR